jgi:hypothetical protein
VCLGVSWTWELGGPRSDRVGVAWLGWLWLEVRATYP